MRRRLAAMTLMFAAAPLAAQQAVAPPPVDEARAAYNAMPNGPGTGPYPALMEVDSGLANHVVYRPADLSGLGKRKLGVLVWGNGGCRDDRPQVSIKNFSTTSTVTSRSSSSA